MKRGVARVLRINGVRGIASETAALISRFASPPSLARRIAIDNLIKAAQSGGWWADMDVMHILSAADTQAAHRNWVRDAFNVTPVTSPTFVADGYYDTSPASSYLDTGYDFYQAAGAKSTYINNHFGIWVRDSVSSNGMDCGNNRNYIRTRTVAGNLDVADATTTNTSTVNANGSGFWVVTRIDVNTFNVYRNGALFSGPTTLTTVSGTSGGSQFIGCFNGGGGTPSSFGARKYRAFVAGRALTAAKALSQYNAINAYMTAIGAA